MAADTKELGQFLTDVIKGRNGYEIGEPWKYSEDSLTIVVPISRKDAPDRKYATLYEERENVVVEDSGSISNIQVQNRADHPVFIRTGSIFGGDGKTQERAAQVSRVFMPGKSTMDVKCVHQSKGISANTAMDYTDLAPNSVTSTLLSTYRQPESQSYVWNSVRNYTQRSPTHRDNTVDDCFSGGAYRSYGRATSFIPAPDTGGFDSFTGYCNTRTMGTDDLVGHMSSSGIADAMNDMLNQVPFFDFQSGAIIFDPVGIVAMELFDSPMSWEAIKKEVIARHGDKIKEEQANHLFEFKPDRVAPAIEKFVESLSEFEATVAHEEKGTRTVVVSDEIYVGEYTTLDDDLIHVMVTKKS